MAHLVETMAYTNEVPWHGLGERIADAKSIKEMVKKAGIDWKVESVPMTCKDTQADVPEFYALRRSTDGKILDVVGNRYQVTQNADAFEFFTDFVEAGDATMETAGSLKGGRLVWGLADLGKSFKLKGKDEVKGYLFLGLPHEQGKSIIAKTTTVRVVCNNTFQLMLREKGTEFRMTHRRQFTKEQMQQAKVTLGIAREQMDQFKENATLLQSKTMANGEDALFFARLLDLDGLKEITGNNWQDFATPTMKLLMDVNRRAPGAQPNNAWGLLNAVTYYADHVASRTPDKRLSNAWLGKTARMKDEALRLLIAA